jgi:flagellar biosynthesis anti-sigma factor FlgM
MTQPVSFSPARAPADVRTDRIAATARHNALTAGAVAPVADVPLPRLTRLASALAAEGPPVDHARLAQISQAIASGDYRIDAAAIADALLGRSISTVR